MYGIPEELDPTIFEGAVVERVSFGPYIVHIDFGTESGLQVSIEASFEHSGTADGGWRDVDKPPLRSSRLMRLAGQAVSSAVIEDSQTLRLSFGDGQTLCLRDDTPQYESFQITHGEDYWVI